jgi:hypothetical protein
MVYIPKNITVMSCSMAVCLTLSNVAIAGASGASDCAEGKGALSDLLKCDQEIRQGIKTVRGDVLRVEGDTLLVKRSDGKEVRVHLDETTQMFGYVGPGEHVEAKMDKLGHALSIRLAE